MNEILQKRIEEAAKKICCTDCPFESIKACKTCIEPKEAKQVAIEILSNQWISVKEALPEYQQDVVVTNSEGDYWTAWRSDDNREHKDTNSFINYGIGEISHWMMIPQLKGGEK